jgi:WD40 repeat protein
MRRLRVLLLLCCLPFALSGFGDPAGANAPSATRPDARGNGLPELVPHLGKTKLRHENMIISAVFAPDAKTVATCGWDNLIRHWDAATGKELRRYAGHSKPIYAVAFTPDGKLLASGSEDRSIRLWDVGTGKELRKFEGHQGGVTKVGFTPDGKRLASSGYDQTVRLWDVDSGKQLFQLGGQQRGFTGFAIAPDGKRLATAAADHSLRLLELAEGKEVGHFRGHQGGIVGVAFSPDGRLLASGSEDQSVRLWHVASGRSLRQLTGHGAGVWAVAFSPDSRYLASAGRDKRVRVWEVLTGGTLRVGDGHADGIPALDFSADGQLLISGSHDTGAILWDWNQGRPTDLRPETSLAPDELSNGWSALAGADAVASHRAIWQLAASRSIVAFLEKQLKPASGLEPGRLAQLIADLDSDTFAVRRRATNELQEMGELAEPALRQLLEGKPSPEVKQRAERLLERLDSETLKPEQLQALRAIEVLERTGTAEARQFVEMLARGADGARTTEEARLVLRRWPKTR